MLEDILKKKEIIKKVSEKLLEAINMGEIERCKELSDEFYEALLEQSFIIAEEMNYLKENLERFNFSEEGKKRIEEVQKALEISYNLCTKELRAMMDFQRKYNLTNAPED